MELIQAKHIFLTILKSANKIVTQINGRWTLRKLRLALSISLLLSLFPITSSAVDIVRYNISLKRIDSKQSYYIDMLTLALEKTVPEYGEYKLTPVLVDMSQGRNAIMVERDAGIDVVWRMTSTDIEQRLSAVYWPLLKGLMGYRIFIIRAERQADFPITMSKEDLRNLVAGQGNDWPDGDILLGNGFNVIQTGELGLLDMLDKRRFDYFPRALHEPWVEIQNRPQFTVERNILLKYSAPMFFFVNKDNEKLKERLNLGMAKAYQDGSFEQLFSNHEITKDILAKANIEQRKVIELSNPLLSDKTRYAMEWIQQFKVVNTR